VADAAVAAKRALRDPSVHEGDGNPAPLCPLQEERPDLRLGQNDEPWSGGRERPLDRTRQIERKREHRRAIRQGPVGQIAASGGRHRESQPGRWENLLQRPHEVARDSDLADGDGVDPDPA
jgi:hypothetical protein